ncbi:hypothetical protein B9Z55_019064 [Caenorhabditis nigoni]|uniref:Uncharacterized protein n=1 Tax=Caenorhabditis nigoni TaxID=1611254 RepID=A0A2G5THG1_9PELO|nr:hypothetical protein B9Z55_019064 [Caenorhabditis nigoni]
MICDLIEYTAKWVRMNLKRRRRNFLPIRLFGISDQTLVSFSSFFIFRMTVNGVVDAGRIERTTKKEEERYKKRGRIVWY